MISFPFGRDAWMTRIARAAMVIGGLGITGFGIWGISIGLGPEVHASLMVTAGAVLVFGLATAWEGISGSGFLIESMRDKADELKRYADAYHAGQVPPPGPIVGLKQDLEQAMKGDHR